MAFPEGMGKMRISGAKRVRVIGEEEPAEKAAPALPLWVSDEPSYGRTESDGSMRGSYLGASQEVLKRLQAGKTPQEAKPFHELEKGKRPERRGGMAFLNSTNIFGLTSRSESLYPEAYRPIMTEHWEPASDKEYYDIIRRQASINKVVSFRDNPDDPFNLGTTDQAYEEAVGRRHQVMRRKRKPRNYEERKRLEEEERKAPLSRRYMARDSNLENTAFVSTGPLDPKVLVPGFSAALRDSRESPKVNPPRRNRRALPPQKQEDEAPKPVPKLPEFLTGGPKSKVQGHRNSFGLVSRSITAYPEAYRDVPQVFWHGLTREQRQDINRVQAAAMEKVGFEPKTQKRFIDDFDPHSENRYGLTASEARQARNRERVTIPMKFFASILLLVTGGTMVYMTLPEGTPETLLVSGVITGVAGIALALPYTGSG